ncbi:YciI family protein [Jiangella gansuensis]|uniref:YciI family protein n=1 Tax=Jiangella gansuensis TaxID=281473 RepID=UPI001FE0ACF1|nr:YciI family protein [Jiangella gansuensis]
MLLIYGNDETWQQVYGEAYDAHMQAHRDLAAQLRESGEFVASAGLTTAEARTVRVRDDATAVTDGPFTEAKEVLAGYYLVECRSAERAAQIAAMLPEARLNVVEVRRVMDPADM